MVADKRCEVLVLRKRETILQLELELQELGRERGERPLVNEQRPQILRLRKAERAVLLGKLAIRHAVGERVLDRKHRALHRAVVRHHSL